MRRNEVQENLTSVYLGGGTPSLLPANLLIRFFRELQNIWDFSTVTEFTAEANPGTISSQWLNAAAEIGVNRLSLGMQAAQDRLLNLLGRIHHFPDVVHAIELARYSGIDNLNLDLIFGIPSQSLHEWEETVNAALSLSPRHLSAYGLIPEEGTPLYEDLEHRVLCLPDSNTERNMYDIVKKIASDHGFLQYEISNFSLPGYECRHNIGYWTQVQYIGLGISSASMTGAYTDANGFSCIRSVNPNTFDSYEALIKSKRTGIEQQLIKPAESRFETMMLALRMNRGISEQTFMRMHGVSIDKCFGQQLRLMENRGLMKHEDKRWKLTERGFDIQNSILVELMDG